MDVRAGKPGTSGGLPAVEHEMMLNMEQKENKAQRPMMRPTLKGNDRIGLMKLFLASFTKALHTYGLTDGHTLENRLG